MAFYVSARLRSRQTRRQRRAFEPRTVWLLGSPQVGRPMALVHKSGHSVITSRIERVLRGVGDGEIYVQTHNSLYRLQRAPLSV